MWFNKRIIIILLALLAIIILYCAYMFIKRKF